MIVCHACARRAPQPSSLRCPLCAEGYLAPTAKPDLVQLREKLEKAVAAANERVWGLAQEDAALEGMGTTVVAFHLDSRGRGTVAHVGDSRAYRYRNGRLEPLTADDIDFLVESDRPLVELPPAAITDLDRTISGFAQAYIPDRATLQVGIGSVPEAVMSDLRSRRDLGIHSGMLGDSVVDLVEAGAISNAYKEVDPGISVTGALIGTRRLFDFCHRNKSVRMHPLSHTHNFAVLSQLSRFVSLNSAVEVDLTGQVNAESAGGQYVGAVGGQVDYVRAAAASPGGHSIIALPSTAQNGAVSRIVARLSGPVTTARSDVDVIITEFGAANLQGKTLSQRTRTLIEIAHPAHRESLDRAVHAAGKSSA